MYGWSSAAMQACHHEQAVSCMGSSGVPAQARARGRGHCTPLVTHPSGVQWYITASADPYMYMHHTRIGCPDPPTVTMLHPHSVLDHLLRRVDLLRRVEKSSSTVCQLRACSPRLAARTMLRFLCTHIRTESGRAHLNEQRARRCQPWQVMRSVRSVAQSVHGCGDPAASIASIHTSTTHSLTHHLCQQCDAPSVGDTSLNAMGRVHVQPGTAGA